MWSFLTEIWKAAFTSVFPPVKQVRYHWPYLLRKKLGEDEQGNRGLCEEQETPRVSPHPSPHSLPSGLHHRLPSCGLGSVSQSGDRGEGGWGFLSPDTLCLGYGLAAGAPRPQLLSGGAPSSSSRLRDGHTSQQSSAQPWVTLSQSFPMSRPPCVDSLFINPLIVPKLADLFISGLYLTEPCW